MGKYSCPCDGSFLMSNLAARVRTAVLQHPKVWPKVETGRLIRREADSLFLMPVPHGPLANKL